MFHLICRKTFFLTNARPRFRMQARMNPAESRRERRDRTGEQRKRSTERKSG